MAWLRTLALRVVPERWRAAVVRDLGEEAAAEGRRGLRRDVWTAWHLVRIGLGLRRRDAARRAPADGRRGMTIVSADVRWAGRMFRRYPWSYAAIVLTLGLGIAATTTVFAVFNHVLFRPTPGVERPGELITIAFQSEDGRSWGYGPVEALDLFRRESTGLAAIAAWPGDGRTTTVALTPGAEPRFLTRGFVTDSYLETLGVRPAIGRLFTAGEIRAPGALALISESLWQREFGGESSVLGRLIDVGGRSFAIVGVLDDYRGWSSTSSDDIDVWLPEAADDQGGPSTSVSQAIARLDPDRSVEGLQEILRTMYAPLRETLSERDAQFVPWVYDGLRVGGRPRGFGLPSFTFVLLAAAVLLALACANAANLLLGMTARRRHELAFRSAIGASRLRLARGLVIESALLAVAAIGAGLAVARVVLYLIGDSQVFQNGASIAGAGFDWRVVAFGTTVGSVTLFAFSLLPVVAASRGDVRPLLQEGARTSTGSHRLGRSLVAAQLALSVLLMAGAGVLIRSYARLSHLDLGMEARTHSFEFDPRLAGSLPLDARQALLPAALEALDARPGIEGVATANPSVFDGRMFGGPEARLDAETPEPTATVRKTTVSPEYFETVGMRLVAGRAFTEADRTIDAGVQPVVVSASLARRLYGETSPLGRQLVLGDYGFRDPTFWELRLTGEVVGVAPDVLTVETVADAQAAFVVYQAADPTFVMSRVYVRSSKPAGEVGRDVREALSSVNSRLLPVAAGTIRDEVERNFREAHALMLLLIVVAVVASVLGCAGAYAVTSQGVAERTREFGVRVALGASAADVMRQAARGVVAPLAFGAAAGVLGYAFAAPLLEAQLVAMAPVDPLTIAAVVLLLILIVGLSTWLPLRRAARVDPAQVLRE